MGRRNLFVGSAADPRVSYFTVACLFETVHKIANPVTQHITDAGACEQATQLSGWAARRTALGCLRWTPRLPLRGIEPFRDFVSVLITRHSEKCQKSCHRRISATHLILLLLLGAPRRPPVHQVRKNSVKRFVQCGVQRTP